MGFLENYQVISPAQFGFCQNFSTTLAISHFYDQILKEKDNNNIVGSIFWI